MTSPTTTNSITMNASRPPPESDIPPFQHGADWVRVDFHLHTRADREFHYDGESSHFISSYVDALEKAHIRLGAISNHNKFNFEEFKALRSAAMKKGIGLLPSVELSVSEGRAGVHVLVLFSDAWLEGGGGHIRSFLTSVFPGKRPEEFEQENGTSEKTLLQVVEMLDGLSRDYFLVCAHVEETKGLWFECGMGKLGEWKEKRYDAVRSRILGFQKVRSYDKTGEAGKPCRTKVRNALGNWYPAEVEGSDPKRIDEIGKGKACYLKLSELSFEAVKFALSAHEDRVRDEVPKRTSSWLCSAHFEGGVLDGKIIRFSPELNTLIGIRGSGKSSILEAIRYALDIPLSQGKRAPDTDYKEGLVKHTLGSGGKITLVAVDTYGQEFTVSRIFREAPNVYLGGKLQPGISIRETVLRRPIYFGQKELASRGDGFERDLVEKLAGEKLGDLRRKIEDQRQRVREAVNRYRKLQDSTQQKAEYEKQLQDATFGLKKFAEYGVENKLRRKIGFQKDSTALERIRGRVDAFVRGLENLMAEHEDDLRNAATYRSTENAAFFEDYFREFAGIIAQVDKVKEMLASARVAADRLDKKKAEFEAIAKKLQDEFAQIERQLTDELKQRGAAAIQPDNFLQLQQRKTKAEQIIAALTKQEALQGTARDSLLAELDALNELWLAEYNAIKDELDRVNANHAALRIEPEFKGDREEAIHFMKSLYQGSNIRESTLRSVMEGYADFGGLFRDLPKAKAKAGSVPELFERTFVENLADFLTWQVPNCFRITYHGKELKHHSLGQRASALILFILSQQENDVIIIDQPEDDLDNQTIYDDVIKLICQMKPKTQFIFATHNPNVPVLGDAEQVHACSYQDECIEVLSGGIDARPVQEAIINIMEGGREAFAKRADIYQLWKSRNSSK